jgi:hypothetical protein
LRRFLFPGLRSAFFIDYQLHKVILDYGHIPLNNNYLIPAFAGQYDQLNLIKVTDYSD